MLFDTGVGGSACDGHGFCAGVAYELGWLIGAAVEESLIVVAEVSPKKPRTSEQSKLNSKT